MAKKMKQLGLLNHLKAWGLKVEPENNWRHRGRPYNFYPRAIMVHHTASPAGSGNFSSLRVVKDGVGTSIPPPLCHILLGRDGTVKPIAVGHANHAGRGGPLKGIPRDQANTYAIGIEAENNGRGEPWSNRQLNAYYRLCAALMTWNDITDVNQVIGHKEWTSRKIDPAGINMNQFRRQVQKALNHGSSVPTVSLTKLRKRGLRNNDVLQVKKALHRKGFSMAVEHSNYFGNGLLHDYKHWQLHLGYRGDDADGIPGRTTLQKLGFRVIP